MPYSPAQNSAALKRLASKLGLTVEESLSNLSNSRYLVISGPGEDEGVDDSIEFRFSNHEQVPSYFRAVDFDIVSDGVESVYQPDVLNALAKIAGSNVKETVSRLEDDHRRMQERAARAAKTRQINKDRREGDVAAAIVEDLKQRIGLRITPNVIRAEVAKKIDGHTARQRVFDSVVPHLPSTLDLTPSLRDDWEEKKKQKEARLKGRRAALVAQQEQENRDQEAKFEAAFDRGEKLKRIPNSRKVFASKQIIKNLKRKFPDIALQCPDQAPARKLAVTRAAEWMQEHAPHVNMYRKAIADAAQEIQQERKMEREHEIPRSRMGKTRRGRF